MKIDACDYCQRPLNEAEKEGLLTVRGSIALADDNYEGVITVDAGTWCSADCCIRHIIKSLTNEQQLAHVPVISRD